MTGSGPPITNPGLVTPAIIASLARADLIIADLSDLNPNVYYELAVAHGMAKPVIHIRRVGERLPFDVQDLRTISYDLSNPDRLDEARTQLYESVVYALAHPEEITTPLTGAGRLMRIQASENPIADSQASMATAVNDLRLQLGREDREVRDAVGELRDEGGPARIRPDHPRTAATWASPARSPRWRTGCARCSPRASASGRPHRTSARPGPGSRSATSPPSCAARWCSATTPGAG